VTRSFISEPDASPEEAAAIVAVLAAVESVATTEFSRQPTPAWRRAALREGVEGNARTRGTQP